jgi:hypothetical protein
MKRSHVVVVMAVSLAAGGLFVWARSSISTAETHALEIGEEQYARLANSDDFPDERLDEVRRLLVDDGRISPQEFKSLRLPEDAATNSKKLLFDRLQPPRNIGVLLHPDEPLNETGFSPAICTLTPPRAESELIRVGESTFQLCGIHYCGKQQVSGFGVCRNGEVVNDVRYFGHSSAEVFVRDSFPCLFRTDLTSRDAYQLLEDFYDGKISDEQFFNSIIDPVALATLSDANGT